MPKEKSAIIKRAAKPVRAVPRSGADTVTAINVAAAGKLARFHVVYRKPCGGHAIAYFPTRAAMREWRRAANPGE